MEYGDGAAVDTFDLEPRGTDVRSSALPARVRGQRCCVTELPAVLDAASAERLKADLDVLAHPVRLRILAVLAASRDPVCVCDLECSVPVKQPTVSHHLKVLREAGVVDSEKRGLWAYYHIRRDELGRLRRRIAAGLGRLGGDDD
jgi:ArsR family transcriptional regulator, arsenate/arsenite/antimonite-responsive transcriptional repressor